MVASTISASAQDAKKCRRSPKGERPNPNFSAGLHAGDTLYVSGQTGMDAKTQKLPESFEGDGVFLNSEF
jgi:enamine deaminase RidA (YjgF/YER057c/UK114 family)